MLKKKNHIQNKRSELPCTRYILILKLFLALLEIMLFIFRKDAECCETTSADQES